MEAILTIQTEAQGVISAFETLVTFSTGENSAAFFDFIGADEYEELTRIAAEAYTDTAEDAYIAGRVGMKADHPFVWLNELRVSDDLITEEALHVAQLICVNNGIASDGEMVAKIQLAVKSAIEAELPKAETPEVLTAEMRVMLSAQYAPRPLAEIQAMTQGVILNNWDSSAFTFNAGLPPFARDTEGGIHLFVFDYIDNWYGVDPRGFVSMARAEGATKISLWLNSLGGDVNIASTVRGLIMGTGLPVEIYMYGICASAATFIGLVPGAKIYMAPMSWQMIHHGQVGSVGGDSKTMIGIGQLLEKFDKPIFAEYGARVGKSGEEFMAMVDETPMRELWLTAEECLQMGLIDGVEAGQMPMFKVAACADLKKIALPNRVKDSLNINPSMKDNTKDSKESIFKQIVALLGEAIGVKAEASPETEPDPGDPAEPTEPSEPEMAAEPVAEPAAESAEMVEMKAEFARIKAELQKMKDEKAVANAPKPAAAAVKPMASAEPKNKVVRKPGDALLYDLFPNAPKFNR